MPHATGARYAVVAGWYRSMKPDAEEIEVYNAGKFSEKPKLEKILETPELCILLYANLDDTEIAELSAIYDVTKINYEREERHAIRCYYFCGEVVDTGGGLISYFLN